MIPEKDVVLSRLRKEMDFHESILNSYDFGDSEWFVSAGVIRGITRVMSVYSEGNNHNEGIHALDRAEREAVLGVEGPIFLPHDHGGQMEEWFNKGFRYATLLVKSSRKVPELQTVFHRKS